MIPRDGTQQSLWQHTTGAFTSSSRVTTAGIFDVAIAGGGITGVTLALLLQEAGRKCILLEARNLGFGTTGGTTAHLNTVLETTYHTMIKDFGVEEARRIANATQTAIELVKSNVERFGIDCGFEEANGYVFAQTAHQEDALYDIVEACAKVGIDTSYTGDIELPVSFTKAIRVPRQAKIHPLRYVHALAKAFEERGGVILENSRVMETTSQNEIVTIRTAGGSFQAGTLVYATHIPPGINLLHLRNTPYRSYAIAVRLASGNYPKGLAYDMYDPYHYYRTQVIDGEEYLIVGGEDHKTGDETNTSGCFLQLESHVRSHFDVSEITDRWSSQFFDPVDGIPYIGHLPGNPENIYVATGYGGNGITYSQIAAVLLKDMIIGIPNPLADVFTPGRIKPIAGFTEFVKHNADVVKKFVGKWLGQDEIHALIELAPGDAQVVKYRDETLALYKDEAGKIYAVNPACTHMKCAVTWNAAEKSWDCPCHGSRFGYDGEVLTGPAVVALEPVEIKAMTGQESS